MKRAIKNSASILHGLRALVFLFFVVAAVTAACGGCKGKVGRSGGGPAPASPASGIGPAGGTVSGPNGAQVIVPAGALASTVDIQIASGAAVSGNFLVAEVTSFSYFGSGFAPPPHVGEQTFALGTDRTPTGIAAYPSGGVVAVGIASGQVFVTKVFLNGTIDWDVTTQGRIRFSQALPRVAVGLTGNVFVAAATEDDESGAPLGGRTEVRVTAFNPNGTVRGGWPNRINVNYHN